MYWFVISHTYIRLPNQKKTIFSCHVSCYSSHNHNLRMSRLSIINVCAKGWNFKGKKEIFFRCHCVGKYLMIFVERVIVVECRINSKGFFVSLYYLVAYIQTTMWRNGGDIEYSIFSRFPFGFVWMFGFNFIGCVLLLCVRIYLLMKKASFLMRILKCNLKKIHGPKF